MSVINPDETHEPDEFHESDDPSRGTQSAAGARRIPALANAGHHEPSIPAVDSTLLDSLDITPRFAPVVRLADRAVMAVSLEFAGPVGGGLSTAHDIRRAARLMEQQSALDERKWEYASGPVARAFARVLPLLVTYDLDAVSDPSEITAHAEAVAVAMVVPDAFNADLQRVVEQIAKARAAGHLICLGRLSDPDRSAMMLSVTEPDIILIGSEFLTGRTESGVGRLSHALGAFAERNPGVYLIADGVDDECTLVTARTIGATHAIGALFTSPTTVADIDCTHLAPLPERRVALDTGGHVTPFDLVGQRLPSRVGSKRALLAMSKSLEQHAMRDGATVVLGTFQRVENYTSRTARRWNNIAQAAGFVGVYGVGMSSMRDGDVRHAPLSSDDPLVREWTVVVVAPHFTAMLSARDRHQDAVGEMERTFDFVQTYDRELVTKAMYVILSRFV